MTSPNTGIPYVPEGTLDPAAGLNTSIDHIDALLQCAVLSMALTAPPGGEINGDLYIVGSPATGAWAGEENNLARYVTEGAFWQFFEIGTEVHLVLNRDDGILYQATEDSPPEWAPASSALTMIDTNDSPDTVFDGVSTIRLGTGVTATEISPGIVEISAAGGSAENGHGTLTTIAIASNVAVMDHSQGGDFTLELTSNVTTFTHSNVATGEANWFTLRLYQDGTGGRTFAVPASWKYGSGVAAYSVSTGITDVDLIQGVSYNDGTTWLISYEKDFA